MSQARPKTLSLDEFKESMSGVYTTSVGLPTIDEAQWHINR